MSDAQDIALETARELVGMIREGDPPNDAALSAQLDRMLSIYHATAGSPFEMPDETWPDTDYQSCYSSIGARFPDYGYYSIADPLDLSPNSASMGDAIDDLVDISNDLNAALWYLKRHGKTAAICHLRVMHFHWAGHARELLLYLHARQFWMHGNQTSRK